MASPDDDYFSRIEEHFGKRRGGPLVLSPKDWQIVGEWKRQEIPLSVVLRGINFAFDRFAAAGPRPDKINSLGFCAQQVAAAWEAHRERRMRDARPEPDAAAALPAAARHLAAAADACRAAAGDTDAGLDTVGTTDGQSGTIAERLGTIAEELDALAGAARSGELDARAVDRQATVLQQRLEAALIASGHEPSLAELGLTPFSPYGA